jgi:hypothetical protein
MKPLAALLCALALSACYSADKFGSESFPLRSGPTAYRIDEEPSGGFALTVSRGEFQAYAMPQQFEEVCRREALAIAHQEVAKRGRGVVQTALLRSDHGRGFSYASCTATVAVSRG